MDVVAGYGDTTCRLSHAPRAIVGYLDSHSSSNLQFAWPLLICKLPALLLSGILKQTFNLPKASSYIVG